MFQFGHGRYVVLLHIQNIHFLLIACRLILSLQELLSSQPSLIQKFPNLHVLQMWKFSFHLLLLHLMASYWVTLPFSHQFLLEELVLDMIQFTGQMKSSNRFNTNSLLLCLWSTLEINNYGWSFTGWLYLLGWIFLNIILKQVNQMVLFLCIFVVIVLLLNVFTPCALSSFGLGGGGEVGCVV